MDAEIVIAPSTYNHLEAEVRTITAIDTTIPNRPVLTLDRPLEYRHFAGTEQYGSEEVEMRSEVGLLTRSVTI